MLYVHLIAATVMILGVYQGRSSISSFSILKSAPCCPSAIAELLENLGVPSISQEWLKLELSHFVHMQVGYIKSCQKIKKSPQKGRGYGHVTYLNYYLRNG